MGATPNPSRRNFGYINLKVQGGKPGNKTVGLHIDRRKDAADLVIALMKAMKHGKTIDITVFLTQTHRDGLTPVTITAPRRKNPAP